MSGSRRAVEALRESEARLQTLLSSLDDLVFELDENGTYLGIWTTNDALLVAPRSELLGRTHDEVISEEVGFRLKQIIAKVGETGRPEIWEYSLKVLAGTRWFRGRVAPIAGSEGSSRRFCLLVRDITAQKEAEQEITRLLSHEQLLADCPSLFQLVYSRSTWQATWPSQTIACTGSWVTCPRTPLQLWRHLSSPRTGRCSRQRSPVYLRVDRPMTSNTFLFQPREGRFARTGERVCALSLRGLTDKAGVVTRARSDVSAT